jgi:hypothetical protein
MNTDVLSDGFYSMASDAPFLSLLELCGVVVLFLRCAAWILFILRNPTNITVDYVHAAFFLAWMATSLTFLKYGQARSKRQIAVDVPWFLAKKTPLISAPFLSIGEKITLWIAAFCYPPAVGIFAAFVWSKSHYMKARQANVIALLCLIVWSVSALLALL